MSKKFQFNFTEGQLNETHDKDWIKARRVYEKNRDDFYASYWYLHEHPANRRWSPLGEHGSYCYSNFYANLDIMVVKVNPKIDQIDGRKKKNTATRVWVEWGPWYEVREHSANELFDSPGYDGLPSHDYRVDTGGKTYEEAIVNLANNVYHLYGSRERIGHDEKLPKRKRR